LSCGPALAEREIRKLPLSLRFIIIGLGDSGLRCMHYVRIYNLIESNIINYLFLVLIFMLQTRIN